MKIRDELLRIIERERAKILEYPRDGLYPLGDQRNLSPTSKRYADGVKPQKADGSVSKLSRAKSAQLLKDLRNRQKSKAELLKDLENFHKNTKHQVRLDHKYENVNYNQLEFDEAKSLNIFLERQREHRKTGYLSPSARSRIPKKLRKDKRLERAKSALPLKFDDKRPSYIQTDRPHRDKSIKVKRTLTPRRQLQESFVINPQPTISETETRVTDPQAESPGYSVKLSYSHYNRSNTGKKLSPKSRKLMKKKKF